jgi:hypothetical protein
MVAVTSIRNVRARPAVMVLSNAIIPKFDNILRLVKQKIRLGKLRNIGHGVTKMSAVMFTRLHLLTA